MLVIQRCRRGMVDSAVDGEMDILEGEGLASSVGVGRFQALGRTQEPVEGDDDEVDDMGVERAFQDVQGVKGGCESFGDGDVGGVGSAGWIIFVGEGLEESSE